MLKRCFYRRLCDTIMFLAVIGSILVADGTVVGSASAADKTQAPATGLRIATFDVDVTPPIGTPMAYDPVRRIDELGLRARGIVLFGQEQPIVLCAIDWIGISNAAHEAFREAIATAAGTDPKRVAVHTLHQHDAPSADFTSEAIHKELGLTVTGRHDGTFPRETMKRIAAAVTIAVASPVGVTHVGFGQAEVFEVASNRRIQGPDGIVKAVRWSASRDATVRAEPEGLVDPNVDVMSFWNGELPVAVISYYACHPQSYYRTGVPSPDFPGIARFIRGQAVPDTLQIHFNGAGGNITAGKYNDGSKENRVVLANRLADGMRRAFAATTKTPITASDVGWESEPVRLPPAKHLDDAAMVKAILAASSTAAYGSPVDQLAYVRHYAAGKSIEISCLKVGSCRVLHMPGELFIEYQLAAKHLRPDLHVMMAAYGDGGPWYIGTEVAYSQGGYEVQPGSSSVGPDAEVILTGAIDRLLLDAP